jgi:glycosyltransferase involved in cell wall biosynthesis
MTITVILCTYNRCQSLARALESVAASKVPDSVEWEVLVVDNNSRDQTHEVIEDFCHRYRGRFRHLFEPRPGKSHALNAGIREARGGILAFMDDDVTVEPSWLQNLTASLYDNQWAGTGGRIVLQWPFPLPNWLSTEGAYARHGFPGFDQGPEAHTLTGPPFGTNMAFRREMFEKHGGFRTDLGPIPGSEIRGEDTEFGRRLIAAGERLRYEPSAVVYHPVPKNKIKREHFLVWGFDRGRADAREFGNRPYLFCLLASWTLRWMVRVEPARRFQAKVIVWEKLGQIVEWYHLTFGVRAEKRQKYEKLKQDRAKPD